MSSRQQLTASNESSRNSSSKIPRLLRQNSKTESASDNDPVYVYAVDAVSGEPKTIMYSNCKVIGSGSFGMVFVARLDGKHEVAIKKVLQDRRYKNRELQILRELRHPNIVSLVYYFYSVANSPSVGENSSTENANDSKPKDTYLNLVQEYVPQALSRVIKHYWHVRQPIPLNYVQLYGFQIIRGLAYVHSKNICHRDIKPQNLLVNPVSGVLKICDFGSTKVLVPGEPNVSYICSRYYRAPELIFGATQYTVRIDMWSAGCVIGELLLGRPLFPGDSGVDQLVEIIKVLGTPTFDEVKEMNPQYSKFAFPGIKSCPWEKLITNRLQCEDAFDLLRRLLVYSPSQRQPAAEAMVSPLFQQLFPSAFSPTTTTTTSTPSDHPDDTGATGLRPIVPFSEAELGYLPAALVDTIRRSGLTLSSNNHSTDTAAAAGGGTSTNQCSRSGTSI